MFALGASQTGCKEDDGGPEECFEHPCFNDQKLYTCGREPETDKLRVSCQDNQQDAEAWCYLELSASEDTPVTLVPCSANLVAETGTEETGGTETGGSDTDDIDRWDPSLHVTYNQNTEAYEIDADFINTLIDHGFAQLGYDRARVEITASGYPRLVDVAERDLVAKLGLRSGDTLTSINGRDLGNIDQQIAAYAQLQYETEFLLTIERSGTTIRNRYTVLH